MEQQEINIKKKKWYQKKSYWIIIGAIILIGGASVAFFAGEKEPQYETALVQKGTIVQTVDATGSVISADELDLRFEIAGKISKIYKQTNEQVKVGDVIAELELGELNARVAQASASVQRSRANLDKVLAGDTDTYVSGLKARLDQAVANLAQVEATSNDAVSNAEAAVETAKNNLDMSEGGEDSFIVQDAFEDMVALLQSVQNNLDNALTQADNILGLDNSLANDEYENVLSALNSSKLSIATSKYWQAKTSKQNADQAINGINIISSHSEISSASESAQSALVAMKDLLFAVSEVLDFTRAIGDLSQVELDTLKSSIKTVRSLITSDYASLINQKQTIESAKNSYSSYLVAYNKAVANLENSKQKALADVASYQALVDQAQANYDDSVNPPRAEDVASAQAQLNEAYASLAQMVAARNKAKIIAPVDGMVGKTNVKIGEFVSSQDVIAKLVSPHYEVKVDIPETDIIKVSLNDSATVTLDAYNDSVEFEARVILIEKGQTIIQDVVYYTVTLSLEEKEGYDILNGMTANVIFHTAEKNDVFFVPLRSVRENEDGKKYVRTLENGEIKEISVEIGLRGDGGLQEITEGVSEGQEVVVNVIED